MGNSVIEQIQKGENKTLELKETLPSGDAIAKTVVAFSNTSGGSLIIGVNDNREIVGINENELFELQDKIASIIYDRCHPNILPEIYTLNVNGKILLVIEVSRGNMLPYYLKNRGKHEGVYVRLGATNRQASPEMIQELERQRVHQSFDEQIVRDYSLDNLNLEPLQKAFEKINKPLDNSNLLSLKLVKQEQGTLYPTRGLLIVLGAYEHVAIKCARFKGSGTSIFLDKKEFAGDLFTQIEQTELFIKNHLNLKAEITGLQRTETYEIPFPAIREALINAIVHRDYCNPGRDIKVAIFDTTLKIISPGGLPNGVILEEILLGRSEIRNKTIARIFKELAYIEQWGSGLLRMRERCRDAEIPEPAIRETGDFVEVEFIRPQTIQTDNYGKIPADTVGKVPDNAGYMPDNAGYMPEYEIKILDYLRINKKITSKEVEKLLQVKERRARDVLRQMCEKRIIIKLGNARSTYYTMNNE